MKKILKINFTDFWSDFNKKDNLFWNLLSQNYDLKLSDTPDILFYSYFGRDFTKYKCVRVFFQGENFRPNFKECDYAFSFDYMPENKRNYRLPLYAFYDDVKKLTLPKDPELIFQTKSKFCAFVVSNKYATKRIKFFNKLSKYKKVDSGGRYLNNIGGPIKNKGQFISEYKFTIAFENSSYPGYTTEKIFEPMLVNSIPIYWGNPVVNKDFNTKSFINVHDFKNEDEVISKIIEIDNNDELYKNMISEPFFKNNEVNDFVNETNIETNLLEIVENLNNITPVGTLFKPTPFFIKSLKNKFIRVKSEIYYLVKI